MTADVLAYLDAERAADDLRRLALIENAEVLIVLGSGWGGAAGQLGTTVAELAVGQLTGFTPSSVPGHRGTLAVVAAQRPDHSPRTLLVLSGRTHLYEGHGVQGVVHPIRVAAALGCHTVVLTNGSGGINETYPVGQPVLIKDHLNLTATSPLVGPRFVDLTDLYSERLRRLVRAVDPLLPEGVYAQLPGPHYETPAEIAMLRTLGADLVGMSTVLEAIAAAERGMSVLALSLVTNAAAGMSGQPLDHAEVLAAGSAASERLGALLTTIVGRL